VATRAAGLGPLALDLDNSMCCQSRSALGDELLDAVDRLHALRNVVVVDHDQLRLALHAAPLVQLGRAF
jgi:hypothetical protein